MLILRILVAVIYLFVLQPDETSKDKTDTSKSTKPKTSSSNNINGNKSSTREDKLETSNNKTTAFTNAAGQKKVSLEGAFGNEVKKKTSDSAEQSSAKSNQTAATTVSQNIRLVLLL